MTFIDIEILDFDANGIERIADFGEELGLGVAGSVVRNGKGADSARALRVHARLGDDLPVEVRPFLRTKHLAAARALAGRRLWYCGCPPRVPPRRWSVSFELSFSTFPFNYV